jgi:hypothetical protein
MKVEQARENLFQVTATGPELSALVGAARMALDLLRADPDAPAEGVAILERVLADYDRALKGGERGERPPPDSP